MQKLATICAIAGLIQLGKGYTSGNHSWIIAGWVTLAFAALFAVIGAAI